MDNLEQLSDDELRRRLLQFGFPNLPVTSTTRKILIKKLRNHIESAGSKLRRETAHAARYSSDEENNSSDTVHSSTKTTSNASRRSGARLGRSARNTIATATAAVPPHKSAIPEPLFARPTAARYHPTQQAATSSQQTVGTGRSLSRSPTSVYVSPVLQGSSGDEDTDGDAMDFGTPAITSSKFGANSHNTTTTTTNGGGGGQSSGSSSGGGGGGVSDQAHYVSDFTQRLMKLRGLTVAHDAASRPQQSQFSTPPAQRFSSAAQPNHNHLGHQQQHLHNNQQPLHLGGMQYQINNNRQHSVDASSRTVSPNGVNFNATNRTSFSPNGGPSTKATSRSNAISATLSQARQRFGDLCPTGVKQSSSVPCILHSMLLGFLVLVAIAYMFINPNLANAIQAKDTKHTLCNADLLAAHVPCIESADLESALHLLRRTADELQRRAVDRRCRDATVRAHISAAEVIRDALETSGGQVSVASLRAGLQDVAYLVQSNPQWGIQQCDADGEQVQWSTVVPHLQQQQINTMHFIIPNPTVPLRCKLYNKLQTFYTLVGGVAFIAAFAYGLYWIVDYVRRVRQARKDVVDFMIADILQALMEKASSAEQPDDGLVVINHLRDQLIMPSQRVGAASAWTEAIRFLEANESRIHFEVGTYKGEDCQMMRWLADPSMASGSPRSRLSSTPLLAGSTSSSSSSSSPGSSGASKATAAESAAVKKWQSPAFDKLNKIREPPTVCLKIRHMFEPHEPFTPALRQSIQDAILEKVQHTVCRVFDVQVDPSTCCVYVRCATSADAGIVHEQINGWWFDSRLVSIKFVHLERYLSRFPNSLKGPKCLQPSNTKMLSMSACSSGRCEGDVGREATTNGGTFNGGDEF